jgi:serine/threonine protein kinase
MEPDSNGIDFMDFKEKYINRGTLGRGGYGTVILSEDKITGKAYAIKRIPIEDETTTDKVEREINNLSQLSHDPCVDGIVCYYDIFRDNYFYYIVMEYIKGENLLATTRSIKIILDDTNLFYKTIIEIIKKLLQSLDYIHSKGFVHSDIKPENIMVRQINRVNNGSPNVTISLTYQPVFVDFGLACQVDKLVSCNRVAGTRGFIDPVLYTTKKRETLNDIWSLGVSFVEIIKGSLSEFTDDNGYIVERPFINTSNQILNTLINAMTTLNISKRPSADDLLGYLQHNEKLIEQIGQSNNLRSEIKNKESIQPINLFTQSRHSDEESSQPINLSKHKESIQPTNLFTQSRHSDEYEESMNLFNDI